ncbi:rhodanese-like domain-containing protein 4A, chloroplastic [Mercurialis annua]|uniref:rhodanese-like domain-containing protein 4A, chloroplastic n=1 Tax=Mercurialis annua TaxID=3986 RepID=UPI00215DF618|nr:rhodanese-like domain-containing protein 4A, chloroplastic [Mercurialis annua]
MVITMESLSIISSSSPPIKNHPKTFKYPIFSLNSHQNPLPISKFLPFKSHHLTKTSLSFSTLHLLTSLPSLASETLTSQSEQVSDKISLESILVSIDNFFTSYPFFVYGCAFIWLVAIPVAQQLLSKYRKISAINAFRKLKEDQKAQLLDIRDKRSLKAMGSPNLRIVKKNVVQVEFSEEDEEGFVKKVLEKFSNPENTVVCILDNFDGNSMKVAELLFKNGFEEALAIRGGVRGKKGWLEIQETLLPPSVHMKLKKKAKVSKTEINGVGQQTEEKNVSPSSAALSTAENQRVDNGHIKSSIDSTPHMKIDSRSPYPHYPDLKPPSSPTPSKP